jgi:hypothetical protein
MVSILVSAVLNNMDQLLYNDRPLVEGENSILVQLPKLREYQFPSS